MSTILQIASTDRNLSIMMKAVKASGIEETLNGVGPFTLLAPVNLAFGKLPYPDTFENLVKVAGNQNRLTDILSYHVLKGKKLLKDFRDGQKLPTANGKEVTITVKDGEVRINGSKILARDMQGSNGVIHSVDSVNLPL
ncbi:MAG: fasciclin domain-containing protein [Chitinophagaceae bacterium]|nr:fasciclin domain-containing protein [Chitinophagaceae bacterium]